MPDLGSTEKPLKVAIVGSGPSGFYATEALFKSGINVQVTMLERLPVPYGLVRSGVAPDHPKLKQVIKVYARIAQTPGYHFVGNVTVGADVSIDDLTTMHHAVIVACGAESDRRLGIPGEDLDGSHTATEFVGWYNGHPDYRDCNFDFSSETAVIIGQGNVAADVARILAKTVDELRTTDIAEHALEVLADSRILDIYVIGRRGPAQAKFTSKELKEFGELADCDPVVADRELELNNESQTELDDKNNATGRKVYEILKNFAARGRSGKRRRVHFTFLQGPAELRGKQGVESIVLHRNRLEGKPFAQSAHALDRTIELATGLVFRSIGYRGKPLPGVPFDEARGVIPNVHGRVLDGKEIAAGLYTAGWIKRGPTGIIGTNRADSAETVNSLLADLEKLNSDDDKMGAEGIYELMNDRSIRCVSFADWEQIDRAEIARGEPRGKPREKFTRRHEMLEVLS